MAIATGLAIAGASVAGAAISANATKKAGEKAADAQSEAADAGIAEQQRQFNAIQDLLSPYVDAGEDSLSAQMGLIGLNGRAEQQQAIDSLQQSAGFQSLLQQGENSILQNASATGGLRGGNTQAAIAQFSPQLLNQQIQQQYSNLGGITSLGQNAASGVGNAGMSTANNISNLLQQQGAAQAGAALSSAQATNQLVNTGVGAIGTVLGGF